MKAARFAASGLFVLAAWLQSGRPDTASAATPATQMSGEQLFGQKCAICHASGRLYPGYVQLAARGVKPAVLGERTNLNKAYVVLVVRNGLGSMPMFTPGQTTDAELDAIAAWLSGAAR